MTNIIVEGIEEYHAKLKKEEAAGSEDGGEVDSPQPETLAAGSEDEGQFQSEESAVVAALPTRDWSDGRGNDPGLAVRQQILNSLGSME